MTGTMTEDIIARVDAWLDSHADWWTDVADRRNLAFAWADASVGDTDAAGATAAMIGIMLALVREAWPGCEVQFTQRKQKSLGRGREPDGVRDVASLRVQQLDGEHYQVQVYVLEVEPAEALIIALEAAP